MEKVKKESGEERETGKLTIVELQILMHGSRRLVHGDSGGDAHGLEIRRHPFSGCFRVHRNG